MDKTNKIKDEKSPSIQVKIIDGNKVYYEVKGIFGTCSFENVEDYIRNQTLAEVLKIVDKHTDPIYGYNITLMIEEIKKIQSQGTKASILNDKAQDLSDEVANRSSVEQNPDANTKNLKGCGRYDKFEDRTCGDKYGYHKNEVRDYIEKGEMEFDIWLCKKCQKKGCGKPYMPIFKEGAKYPDDYVICGFTRIGNKIMLCEKCQGKVQ